MRTRITSNTDTFFRSVLKETRKNRMLTKLPNAVLIERTPLFEIDKFKIFGKIIFIFISSEINCNDMHYNFLKVLEEANILENIKRICGASAGSIMALLFAVGYSTKEMKEIMFNSNLTKKSTGLLLRPIASKSCWTVRNLEKNQG